MGDVVVAKLAGFCFGVSRAVESVEKTIDGRSEIYTLGKLIHNPTFIKKLEEKGVRVIDDSMLDEIFASADEKHPVTVCTRAHGVTRDISEKLSGMAAKNSFFKVVDCTCPYVAKIHKIARECPKNAIFCVLGAPDHPEVKGFISETDADVIVAPTADELIKKVENLYSDDMKNGRRIVLVAQTTQKLSEWEKIQKICKISYGNSQIYDTICSVTENRQNEVSKLSRKMDMMIIIGGQDSSNTQKLYQTSLENLQLTFLIEDASSIPLEYVKPHMKVGIAAGASTPGEIIQEVQNIMSENIENMNTAAEEDFAQMVEESLKPIRNGSHVKGIVTSVADNEIHVDIGGKFTGIITYGEITDDPSVKLTEVYKPGDEIEAVVIKVNDAEGIAQLSKKKIDVDKNWQAVVDAFNNQEVLDAKIIDVVKGGVIGLVGGVRVFIPASQSGLPKDADLSELKGQTKQVRVIDLNEQRKRVVASIRSVEREQRKAQREAFWSQIEPGQVYHGEVKSFMPYGAFVDLGGVDGMVHITELSWKRLRHPSDVLKIGDMIDVIVKDVDKDAKRISLTCKNPEEDPWKIFTDKYQEGDIAHVKIVSLTDFGAFAEVVPGADGLIHVSQISREKIGKPSDVLKVGDEVDAKITKIDPETHKISLSIKAAQADDEE